MPPKPIATLIGYRHRSRARRVAVNRYRQLRCKRLAYMIWRRRTRCSLNVVRYQANWRICVRARMLAAATTGLYVPTKGARS